MLGPIRFCCLVILGCQITTSTRLATAADQIVYVNKFDDQLNATYPEWTSSPIVYINSSTPKDGTKLDSPKVFNIDSPNGKQRFLGPFGGPRLAENTKDFNRTRVRQTIRLKLHKLPPHRSLTVEFELYVLSSWDGNNPHYGSDRWSVAFEGGGGATLLDTSFSNNPKTGAYDLSNQDYPSKESKFQTGAAAVNTLGSTFFGDSVYEMKFTFAHDEPNLTLNFSSDLFEGKGTNDEAWGLDNVKVTTHEMALTANSIQPPGGVQTTGESPSTDKSPKPDDFSPLVVSDDLAQLEIVGLEKNQMTLKNCVIRLSGDQKKHGYVATKESYRNYVLKFDWMYEKHNGKPSDSNSGLILHIQKPGKVWPKCIEVQLWYKEFGDFFTLDGAKFNPQFDDRQIRDKALKPLGEWNRQEVTCNNGAITVKVNDKEYARGIQATPDHGQIGWMFEGSPIHYRNLKIKKLK